MARLVGGPAAEAGTGSRSVDRAAQVLALLLAADDRVTLQAVMDELGLPKSTAARLLRSLERCGLAQRGPAGGFRPGPALAEWACRTAQRRGPASSR